MEFFRTLPAGGRRLLRRPAYALLVTGTLAIGVGGTTAVFALVDGVLLNALPFEEADRLVVVDATSASTGFGISLSIPHYMDWRDRTQAFSHFGASAGWNLVREAPDGAERLSGRLVLGDFFALLGMGVEVGRTLVAEETAAGAAPVAVLGHGFRTRAFGSDPDVIGRSITLDGVPHTVVGVLRPGQGYPSPEVDVYLPMGARSESLPWEDRGSSFGARALARMREGITLTDAQRDMDRVVAEVTASTPDEPVTATVRRVREVLLGDVTRGIWLLMGAVVLVLFIAGANVANLTLARAEGRGAELQVRRALGAGRTEIARLLLAETIWLSLVGGGAGVLLAFLVVGGLPSVLPVQIPTLVAGRIGIDGAVLFFALGVTIGMGVLFGLAPILRPSLRPWTAGAARRTTGDLRGRWFREILVGAQVSLSVVLLVSAGLLARSLGALSSVEKGFEDDSVFTARLVAADGTFEGEGEWLGFYDGVLERLAADAGVEAAAATLLMPLTGSSWEMRIRSEGGPIEPQERPSVLFNVVSEEYFDALSIRLLQGRAFTGADRQGAPLVAVVDETMAERFWPGQDPLGRSVSIRETEEGPEWRTVVGVAANTRHYELTEPSRIQVYIPMRQAGPLSGIDLRMAVKLRAAGAVNVPALLRETVAELEPSIPVVTPRMMEEYVADAMGASRALGVVTGVFATLATALATLGVFGVLSLTVSRRARELGIRMAVGASPGAIIRMVAAQGMRVVLAGAVVGLAAAAGGALMLRSFLFEVRSSEPGVYVAALALLMGVAVIAVAPPAMRAAATHPSEALGAE